MSRLITWVYIAILVDFLQYEHVNSLEDNCPLTLSDTLAYTTDYENVFFQPTVTSLYECAAECMTSSSCVRFTFDPETRTCRHYGNVDGSNDLQERVFDVKHWPKALAGLCSSEICGSNSKCRVLRLDQTECVPAFPQCGDLPEVENAEAVCEGHFPNDKTHYSCIKDFRSCGNITSECLQSGKWSNVTGQCRRYRWINPTVPFNANLPCGIHDGFRVSINGTPTKHTRFDVSVEREADSLMTVSVRFKFGRDTKTIVTNTYRISKWGREKRYRRFPMLNVGLSFNMEIVLWRGVYEVFMNGDYLLSFKERMKGAMPNKLTITYDIKIKLVEVSG